MMVCCDPDVRTSSPTKGARCLDSVASIKVGRPVGQRRLGIMFRGLLSGGEQDDE